ncbi:MAG: hypothetical protein WCW26_00245 [Candidatus Buchananbacteria bacterium]
MKKNLLFCFFILALLPLPALAGYSFNPHFIITDEEMTDHTSMSVSEIQRFLDQKSSGIANRYFLDYQNLNKKAAEIIWQAAQESKINPKMLLATLQKEQSLIGDPSPSQNQLDKAMGYRCPDSGGCNPRAAGFGKQVDGAAWQFRQYFDNPFNWHFQVGNSYVVDNTYLIAPVNQATASLYNYTPHYSGNQHFWQIWQSYWGKDYPDGSLLKTEKDPGVWFLQYGIRRLISSYSVLLSRFNPKKILIVTEADLKKYEIGPAIKFHNYALIHLPSGKAYLLVDDKLHYIDSEETFRVLGFNWEEVVEATEADLAGYGYGDNLTVKSAYPTGTLLQNTATAEIFFVQNGIKQPVLAKEIITSNFGKKTIVKALAAELEKYTLGEPLKFRDGELVKSTLDSKVYVISDGYRRWIKTEEAFNKFGYKWYNVINTDQKAIEIQPLGQDIE